MTHCVIATLILIGGSNLFLAPAFWAKSTFASKAVAKAAPVSRFTRAVSYRYKKRRMSPMSNEILSPSKKTGFTRPLAGKVSEMLEPGLLKSPRFRQASTEEIDSFVKAQDPESLSDAIVAQLEARFEAFVGRVMVLVDYSKPDAIARAIEENNFDSKYLGLQASEIPLVGNGKVGREVHEVHFGKTMYNRDLPATLKAHGISLGYKKGFRFPDPLTTLLYALKLPDRQRQHPLAILFEVNGRLFYLYLFEHARGRLLGVGRYGPDDLWFGPVRFLAVCEES